MRQHYQLRFKFNFEKRSIAWLGSNNSSNKTENL